MFDIDKWSEIISTIQKNKLRTFLTGFSVAWGIFMLIILLGAGTGLENGVKEEFKGSVNNGLWISAGQTSMPYKGFEAGRKIQLTNEDYQVIKRLFSDRIGFISARSWMFGDVSVTYKNEYGNFTVSPCHPDYGIIKNVTIDNGRFLNNNDLEKRRKVAAIGYEVKKMLFKGKGDDTVAVGKYIYINEIPFQVVGVFMDYGGGNDERRRIYVPIYTAQQVFNKENKINQVSLTTGAATLTESNKLKEDIRTHLAKWHKFNVKDRRALSIWHKAEDIKRFTSLFLGIRIFIWIVGMGTIIAGIVGVSNIMMIVVKERTKEIGIRKAIGATPLSIVSLILFESILITGVAGYIGLVLGVGLLELITIFVPPSDFFRNPQVNFSLAISATILLVISGAIAGFVPSLKAARIKPIVALRAE